MSAAGWRMPAFVTGNRSLDLAAVKLAAEFGDYHFGICHTWDGRALTAVRKRDADGPGVCVVITPDADEMRRALLEGDPAPGAG